MQAEIDFAPAAISEGKIPEWQKILRILMLRQMHSVPWVSILELRDISGGQAADVRVRELRRRLDKAAKVSAAEMDAFATWYLTKKRLISQVKPEDMVYRPGSMARMNTSIAVFRVKHGQEWLWVYMLTMTENQVIDAIGDPWK